MLGLLNQEGWYRWDRKYAWCRHFYWNFSLKENTYKT